MPVNRLAGRIAGARRRWRRLDSPDVLAAPQHAGPFQPTVFPPFLFSMTDLVRLFFRNCPMLPLHHSVVTRTMFQSIGLYSLKFDWILFNMRVPSSITFSFLIFHDYSMIILMHFPSFPPKFGVLISTILKLIIYNMDTWFISLKNPLKSRPMKATWIANITYHPEYKYYQIICAKLKKNQLQVVLQCTSSWNGSNFHCGHGRNRPSRFNEQRTIQRRHIHRRRWNVSAAGHWR